MDIPPYYEYINNILPCTPLLLNQQTLSSDSFYQSGIQAFEFVLHHDSMIYLSESRKHKSNEFDIRVILNFCKNEAFNKTSNIPLHLNLVINNILINLPQYLPYDRVRKDGRRFPRPIDVTDALLDLCELHKCVMKWVQNDLDEKFYVVINLMRIRSCDELNLALFNNSFRQIHRTSNLIIDRSKSGTSVITTSLICPMSLIRISIPVRGTQCTHLQCFDSTIYLKLNFHKPTWICPICDQTLPFHCLEVDELIFSIINDTKSKSINKIIFNEHGQWSSADIEAGTSIFQDVSIKNNSNIKKSQENNSETLNGKYISDFLPSSDWKSLEKKILSSVNILPIISEANKTNSNNNDNSFHKTIQFLSTNGSDLTSNEACLKTNVFINSSISVQSNINETLTGPTTSFDTDKFPRSSEDQYECSNIEKDIQIIKQSSDIINPKFDTTKSLDHEFVDIMDSTEECETDAKGGPKVNSKPLSSSFISLAKSYFIDEEKANHSPFACITLISNGGNIKKTDRKVIALSTNIVKCYQLNELIGFLNNDEMMEIYILKGVCHFILRTSHCRLVTKMISKRAYQFELAALEIRQSILKVQNNPTELIIEISKRTDRIDTDKLQPEPELEPKEIPFSSDMFTFTPALSNIENRDSFLKMVLTENEIRNRIIFLCCEFHDTVQYGTIIREKNSSLIKREKKIKVPIAVVILDYDGKVLFDSTTLKKHPQSHIMPIIDFYHYLTLINNIINGKILIGHNVGESIKILRIQLNNIVGIRDLSSAKCYPSNLIRKEKGSYYELNELCTLLKIDNMKSKELAELNCANNIRKIYLKFEDIWKDTCGAMIDNYQIGKIDVSSTKRVLETMVLLNQNDCSLKSEIICNSKTVSVSKKLTPISYIDEELGPEPEITLEEFFEDEIESGSEVKKSRLEKVFRNEKY